MIDIWTTKYWNTEGIVKYSVNDDSEGLITIMSDAGYPTYFHTEGKDWHKSESAAISRANEMKDKKIKSINKQLAKITAIKF